MITAEIGLKNIKKERVSSLLFTFLKPFLKTKLRLIKKRRKNAKPDALPLK
jgi:hypothetical protein